MMIIHSDTGIGFEPSCVIVEECPCNLCNNFRENDGEDDDEEEEEEGVDVALLSDEVALSCPDSDECERAVEKVDVQLYK